MLSTLPDLHRRTFLRRSVVAPVVYAAGRLSVPQAPARPVPGKPRVKLSCNLYSFHTPLTNGGMTLSEVVDYCAELGFDGVDPTGYYFTGYPAAASDEEVYRVKQRVFRLGLEISGTGVRNDFALADPAARQAEVAHVIRWIDVAAKLGAPVLRVFAGREVPPGATGTQVLDWVVDALRPCVEQGARRGVMIALQNHHDALKTADQILEVHRRIGSDWFGLNVDVGSLRMGDPYADIARLAPLACTWQLKEHVYRGEHAEPTDLAAVVRILRESGYRGYVPIETLGPGDPRVKVRRFLADVRAALAAGGSGE